MSMKSIFHCSMVIVIVFGFSQFANATLGGSKTSVDADRTALRAVHRTTTTQRGYTVEEIVSDAVTIREYLSTSGVVFAVAWNGYVHPDLSQILGSYWGEYATALKKSARKFGHRSQHVESDNIIVEKSGHMRDLRGRAYVPGLLPPGVSTGSIK